MKSYSDSTSQQYRPALDMLTVSIIVPAFNRGHLIGLTIESLLRQNYPADKYEIIIADNNSSDNTAEIVKSFGCNPVPVKYFLESKQGVHYARNSAAKVAQGEILYYTDDDMIADENLLTEITQLFIDNPEVASATGKVLPKWQAPPPDWVLKYCNNSYLSLNDLGEGTIISNDDIGVFSCHQAIRRSVFMQTGGFNPENTNGEWIGDGETGLNIKIKALGYKFGYNSKSVTYHIIPPERTTQKYLNGRFKNQGNSDSYTFFTDQEPNRASLALNILRHISQIFRSFVEVLTSGLYRDDSWHIKRAKLSYWAGRIKYDIRLMVDRPFKETVLQRDWLNL